MRPYNAEIGAAEIRRDGVVRWHAAQSRAEAGFESRISSTERKIS